MNTPRVRSLDEALHILCCMIEIQRKTMILIKIVGCDKSDILDVAIVAQRVSHMAFLVFIRASALDETSEGFRAVNRHDVALAAVGCDAQLADLARVGAQEEVLVWQIRIARSTSAFKIQTQTCALRRRLRDDVDDAADGVGAVLRARRAADDLDALDVLRAEPLQLVARARILGEVAHDGLTVDENQSMARLRAANRERDAPHSIDAARHACLVEDDVLDRLRLLLLDVLFRDDRRRLRLVLRILFRGVRFDVNGSRLNVYPPRTFMRLCRTKRQHEMERDSERQRVLSPNGDFFHLRFPPMLWEARIDAVLPINL